MNREVDNLGMVLATVKGITMDKVNQAGDLVRDAMKSEVPIDSGELKKSIRIRRYPKTISLMVIAGNKKAFYVHMVEFGTDHSPADPFMQRALDKVKPQIKAIFGETVTVK
jgi:HK97 gp10 family phage protein